MKNIKVESILYVEDEKNIQKELADILKNFCEKLYIADDGKQGLDLFDKNKPDIVISDIKMPHMNGIEMGKAIKEKSHATKIIFLTAFSDPDYLQEAIEIQVDGYVLKPIDVEVLINKLNSLMEEINIKKELEKKEQILIQQSKYSSMGQIMENIIYQWKYPLEVISSNASNLKYQSILDPKSISNEYIKKSMEQIDIQVNYLVKTINDFRGFLKSKTKSDTYNLKEHIQRCINLVKATFHNNMIKTLKDIDEDINTYGHPEYLIQALVNILNNSKDALSQIKDIEEKIVFISCEKEGKEHFKITIKDNAGGIPENIIDDIFEPYFTTKGNSLGIGLGLYITQTLITKNLNGQIEVENENFVYKDKEYKGAKFTITIPIVTN